MRITDTERLQGALDGTQPPVSGGYWIITDPLIIRKHSVKYALTNMLIRPEFIGPCFIQEGDPGHIVADGCNIDGRPGYGIGITPASPSRP